MSIIIFSVAMGMILCGLIATFILPKRVFMNDVVAGVYMLVFLKLPLAITIIHIILETYHLIIKDNLFSLQHPIYVVLGAYMVFYGAEIFERIGEINPCFKRK